MIKANPHVAKIFKNWIFKGSCPLSRADALSFEDLPGRAQADQAEAHPVRARWYASNIDIMMRCCWTDFCFVMTARGALRGSDSDITPTQWQPIPEYLWPESARKRLAASREAYRNFVQARTDRQQHRTDDSERKAETAETRRLAEREERLAAEKVERDEREQGEEHERVRRADAAVLEARRQEELREAREALRRIEAVRDARFEQEREENSRRYEERLAHDREEARQRHDQMMLFVVKMGGSKSGLG
ncbi:hypothetical protein PHYSODRAFT_306581 [Phytophthora sojae]|uniref:Uncharacterized protein n=1 Tax=Phytophthora sojae (strain P6497) TaxID=1094619 RepID=G5A9W0_PHYSP|nr:hypothetical protein PHYSODRAFT_306581 [Phytophthora sojae]EGZ07390.1 hypothetical protein PHYSODRAFT_306581 [Phytophthora sojae]|eukprot:XP_009536956.1 hypothetical protein PHYSODRAFT_306581 [Phytophthora sojae]